MITARRHIDLVGENKMGGQDFWLTDPHAKKTLIEAFFKNWHPANRYFFGGDCVDKGEDPRGLLRILRDKKYKDQIFCIRGNHEDMCLKAIPFLEFLALRFHDPDREKMRFAISSIVNEIEVADKASELNDLIAELLGHPPDLNNANDKELVTMVDKFWQHLRNVRGSGPWFSDLFIDEITDGKIRIEESKSEEKSAPKKIVYQESEFREIQEFFESLPYIILKYGKNPFFTVHADLCQLVI